MFPPGDIPLIIKFCTDPPGKQNIATGESIKLCCHATGEQPLKYSWWFSRKATVESSTIVLPNGNVQSLMIIDAKEKDHEGFYHCRVTNDFGEITSNYLHIKVGEFYVNS